MFGNPGVRTPYLVQFLDDILRLKQITGLAALFKDIQFGKAWLPMEGEEDEAAVAEDSLEE